MHHMRQDKNMNWKQTPPTPTSQPIGFIFRKQTGVSQMPVIYPSPQGDTGERDALWTVGRSNGTCPLWTDLTPRRTLRNRRTGRLSLVVLMMEPEPCSLTRDFPASWVTPCSPAASCRGLILETTALCLSQGLQLAAHSWSVFCVCFQMMGRSLILKLPFFRGKTIRLFSNNA